MDETENLLGQGSMSLDAHVYEVKAQAILTQNLVNNIFGIVLQRLLDKRLECHGTNFSNVLVS